MTAKVQLGSAAPEFDFSLRALAYLTVLGADANQASFHLRFASVVLDNRASTSRADLEAAASELERSAGYFDIRNGSLSELRIPSGLSPITANVIRQVASAYQIAPGTGPRTAEEFDTTGRYVAEYGPPSPDGTISKRKIRYVALLGEEPGTNLQVRPRVIDAQGRIRLSASGELEEGTWQEETKIEGAQVGVHSFLSLRLGRVGTEADPDLSDLLEQRERVPAIGGGQPWGAKVKPGVKWTPKIGPGAKVWSAS